jgi:hypothetical protein
LRHIRRSTAHPFLIDQVGHPDPYRVDPCVHRVPAVATLVPPLFIHGVRGSTVDLNASAVFDIQVVQVPIASLLPDPRLACRRRQPVGMFHTPHVPEFKNGERAVPGVAERQLDVEPPLDPRPCVQRGPKAQGSGPPTPDGTANPVIGLVKGARAVDEVKHRLLDPGAWRRQCRVPGALE